MAENEDLYAPEGSEPDDEKLQAQVAGEVVELCRSFPAPGIPVR